jgi:nitrogen fixation NifU-like protein
MSDEIYQKALMRLAADATGAGELDNPDASVTVDNPLCGDRITLDIKLDENRKLAQVAHHVRACVLCQASASMVGAHAAGHSGQDLKATRDAVEAMLKGKGPVPDGDWQGLEAFAPVAGHKSRHACVLLPFNALLEALDKAGAF